MISDEARQALAVVGTQGKTILMFNKVNGAYVNSVQGVELSELSGGEFMTFVEVDSFHPHEDVVLGFYPDYQIVKKTDLPEKVYESEFDKRMAEKITKKYPIAEQINVLSRAIQKLAEQAGVELGELEDMLDYIQLAKDTNREHKEAAKNDPSLEYVTNADLDQAAKVRLAGALHEVIGPRTIEGGRVFS